MPMPFLLKGRRAALVVGAVLAAVFFARAVLVWRDLPGRIDLGLRAAQVQLKGNPRAEIWVRSIECGRLHPGALIACLGDGAVVPLEAYWHDDLGVPRFGALLAKGRAQPVDAVFLSRIHLGVNILGTLLLCAVLVSLGLRAAGLAALAVGAVWALPGAFPSPDVSAGFTGILLLTIAALLRFTGDPSRERAWVMAGMDLLAWLGLAAAYLLRQNIGVVGLVLSLPWLLRRWLEPRAPYSASWWRPRILVPALLCVALLPSAVISLRDFSLGLEPTGLMKSHGFSHALVTGLGTEANPWGLEWADGTVFRKVQAGDAGLEPRSPAYQARAFRLYMSLVLERPGSALAVYARKLAKSLRMPVTLLGVNAFLLTLLSLAGLVVVFRWKAAGPFIGPIAAVTAANLLLLLQSVLVIPLPVYFHPVAASTALLVWLWAESLISL
jgi:hypothetical protein